MTDRFYIPGRGHFSFYGVFDGHGGRAAAIFTRDHLFLLLHAALSSGLDPAAALTQAYLQVDAAFIAVCRGQEEEKQAAERERAAHAAADAAAAASNHAVLTLPSSDSLLPHRRQQSANLMISVPSSSLPASNGSSLAAAARSSSEVTSAQQPPAEKDTSGTTAVSILLHHESYTLWAANCGDSRAVLSTSNGAIVSLTNDHKADRVDEADRIRRAGGFVVHKRVMGELAISRAIGDLDFKEDGFHFVLPHPEIAVQVLSARDEFILLACDGIFDVLTNELACSFVRKELSKTSPATFAPSLSLDDVSMAIVRHAIDALNTRDNVTVVLVKLPARAELLAAHLDRPDVPALEPGSTTAGVLYDSHVMLPPPLPASVASTFSPSPLAATVTTASHAVPIPIPVSASASAAASSTPAPAPSAVPASTVSAASAQSAASTPAFTHAAPVAVSGLLPPAAALVQQPGRVLAPHRASSASLSRQSSNSAGGGDGDGDSGIQFHEEELMDQDEQTLQEEAHMRRTMQR